MDALKKAEQEKKEAAKRQLETDTSAPEKTGKSLNDTASHATAGPSETDSAAGTSEGAEKTGRLSTTAELELEPISTRNEQKEIPEVKDFAAAGLGSEDQTLNVTMNTLSLSELPAGSVEIDDAEAPELPNSTIADLQIDDSSHMDETFHGVSLVDNPELFQETVQGEAFFPTDAASETYGETLPGIPAAQLAKDIGSDDQPTPVAAQTVFAATRTTESSGNGLKWTLVGLCLVAFIAGTIWMFYGVTPINRMSTSPQVAAGIESIVSPLSQAPDLNPGSVSGTLAGDIETAIPEQGLAEEPTLENGSDALLVADDSEQTMAEAPATAEATEEVNESDSTENTVAGQADLSMDDDEDKEKLGLPDRIITEQSLIRISRSKNVEDKGQTLRDAYSEYQNGNYEQAESKYRTVLKDFPDNRDALLGLGAIASNRGDSNSAYQYYARLLSVNPGDELAKVALINLQDTKSLMNSESAVKSMLHENPNTHALHFTLGKIYASGNRWAEAQQAFFEAYSLNTGSPDYAMNLAISLDHIGQRDTALKYYLVTLELSDSGKAGMDSTRLQKRIAELNKLSEK
jgi:Flp pilus assembly protein TadD